jgi:hypothetical protein
MNDPKLILLSENDNVLVCIADIAEGDELRIEGDVLRAGFTVSAGHKIARRALCAGEKIVKYGAPIGSAITAIAAGEWVHGHNMQSDYIPTHDRKTVAPGADR